MSDSRKSEVCKATSAPATLRELKEQFGEHALKLRAVREDTVKGYAPYLRRFFDYFEGVGPPELFSRMTPQSLSAWLVSYGSSHGPGSRRNMQNALRQFLRFCYLRGYLEHDFRALIPSPRSPRLGHVVRAIDPSSIERLVESLEGESPEDLRDAAIVCLLSTYGVRGVQLRRLRLADLDWSGERIVFPAAKGGRRIEAPLTPQAGNRLALYLRDARPKSAFPEVFVELREPFAPLASPGRLSKLLARRMRQAGIHLPEGVRYGSHCFRHAFATRLCGKVPFKELVDMLGHRDPATTLIYGKVDLRALAKASIPWPGGERR